MLLDKAALGHHSLLIWVFRVWWSVYDEHIKWMFPATASCYIYNSKVTLNPCSFCLMLLAGSNIVLGVLGSCLISRFNHNWNYWITFVSCSGSEMRKTIWQKSFSLILL